MAIVDLFVEDHTFFVSILINTNIFDEEDLYKDDMNEDTDTGFTYGNQEASSSLQSPLFDIFNDIWLAKDITDTRFTHGDQEASSFSRPSISSKEMMKDMSKTKLLYCGIENGKGQ